VHLAASYTLCCDCCHNKYVGSYRIEAKPAFGGIERRSLAFAQAVHAACMAQQARQLYGRLETAVKSMYWCTYRPAERIIVVVV
jgi:hypothetical protein